MKLEMGMPIVLKNVKGLDKHPLWHDQKGMANALVSVEGQDLVLFMPDNSTRMYYIEESRVVIDEDRIEAWLDANAVEVS